MKSRKIEIGNLDKHLKIGFRHGLAFRGPANRGSITTRHGTTTEQILGGLLAELQCFKGLSDLEALGCARAFVAVPVEHGDFERCGGTAALQWRYSGVPVALIRVVGIPFERR